MLDRLRPLSPYLKRYWKSLAWGGVAVVVYNIIKVLVPIVIGQNSPCGSYAVGRPIAETVEGKVGMVSLDTHWDAWPYDWATMSEHVAGSTNWKDKLYRDCPNFSMANLVEIGER